MAFSYQTSKLLMRKEVPSLDEVSQLAQRRGWPLLGDDDANKGKYEVLWEPDPSSNFHYVEDGIVRMCYVSISGATASIVQHYADIVASELDLLLLPEITERVDAEEDPLSFGREIIRLGIAAPYTYDGGVYARISGALQSPDDRVRDMALWAATYSPYAEYRPILRTVAENDQVPRIRERAAMVLEAFDHAGVAEP